MVSQVTFSIRPNDDELTRVLSAAEQWLQQHELDDEITKKILLCIDEVVINVIHYGSLDKKQGVFFITLFSDPSKIMLRSCDNGRLFDPTTIPLPNLNSSLEARPVGGLGVHIIRSFMDNVEYARKGNYNELTLTKFF